MENRNVLFVDDELNILSSLRRGLIDEEYRCFFANSGKEAIEIMKDNDIHVIVSDMRMPEMNGLELLKYVKENYPDIVKMVLSGYAQLPQVIATINQIDVFKFILKPWKLEEELKKSLNEAIEFYNLKHESEKLKKELEKKNKMYQAILKSTGEKFEKIKNDMENFRELNNFANSYIKNIASQMKLDDSYKQNLLAEINLLQKITGIYIKNIPSEYVDFNLNKLYNDMESYISNLEADNDIEVEIRGGEGITYHGNYRLIYLVIITFIKYILDKIDFKLLKLSLLGKESKELSEFYFFAEIIKDEDSLNNKFIEASIIKIITLLNKIIGNINGRLTLTDKDRLLVAILRIAYDK